MGTLIHTGQNGRTDEVHVPCWGGDDTGDGVRALLHRRAGRALRNVVLSSVATDACVPAERADVDGRVVLLEIEAPLEVVLQRLVLPRDFLIRIQQVPAMVASRQPSDVSPNVARWVFVPQHCLARVGLAAGRETDGAGGLAERVDVGDGASAPAKLRGRVGTDAGRGLDGQHTHTHSHRLRESEQEPVHKQNRAKRRVCTRWCAPAA